MPKIPEIHETVFLAQGSVVVKDVTIGAHSSIWYNTVVRGDGMGVRIGARTNVQDNVVVHGGQRHPVSIGDDVSIGHGAIVHGCTIGNSTLIGMGSIIMNGAVIGEHCIVGAGALVTGGMVIPDGHVAYGSPAKVVGPVTEEQIGLIDRNAEAYLQLMEEDRRLPVNDRSR